MTIDNLTPELPAVGFIGLGAMGCPMAHNLVQAGYRVSGLDNNPERLAAAQAIGIVPCQTLAEMMPTSDIILVSLPSSDIFVQVAEQEILPLVQAPQIVIDLGTTTPPETRRLAERFGQKGVDLLDVPLSGGPGGVQNKQLYMFAAGPEATFTNCRPLLEAIGGADRITYCGTTGNGQVVKGVNQLMMGLVNAAYLETIAFGVNAGVDPDVIVQAIGHIGRWRVDFNQTAKQIADGKGPQVGVKFRELPYFINEAKTQGFPLPLTELLYQFCDAGERVVIDDNRPAPSFWHQLTGM